MFNYALNEIKPTKSNFTLLLHCPSMIWNQVIDRQIIVHILLIKSFKDLVVYVYDLEEFQWKWVSIEFDRENEVATNELWEICENNHYFNCDYNSGKKNIL